MTRQGDASDDRDRLEARGERFEREMYGLVRALTTRAMRRHNRPWLAWGEVVERWPLPVVLDLWAPWCGPCRMLAPVLDQLASELAGRVRFAKLNVDENPRTASRFEARSIPNLLVLKASREVDRLVGVQPRAEIVRRLERVIA